MDVYKKNEQEVNNLVVKIFTMIIFIFPLSLILNYFNVFVIPWIYAFIMSVLGTIACLVPIIGYKLKMQPKIFKYIVTIDSLLLATFLYSIVFVNSILLFIVPIGIACLYFDERLIKTVFILLIPFIAIGEYFASIKGEMFIAAIEWIPLHLISFTLQLALLAGIFTSLTNRSKNMLMKQQQLFDNIKNIFDKSNSTAIEVSRLVDNLHMNMKETNNAVAHIVENIELINAQSEDFQVYVHSTNDEVNYIADKIKDANRKTENIKEYSNGMKLTTEKSKEKLALLKNEVDDIKKYAEDTKQKILTLSNHSNEIQNAINLITDISQQTNLLSLNASIEAARAGNEGKGFAVVANEIRKLSNESEKSAQNIKNILEKITIDIDNAVSSVQKTYETIINILERISYVDKSFDDIVKVQQSILEQQDEINSLVSSLHNQGQNIKSAVNELSIKNNKYYQLVSEISTATQQLSAASQQIISFIEDINQRTKQLSKIKISE